MSIIYMLLAVSVFVALVFFAVFIFSVKKGQYDDTYTPSVRMLFEDELVKTHPTPTTISEPSSKSFKDKQEENPTIISNQPK